jgi:hypothetical protein
MTVKAKAKDATKDAMVSLRLPKGLLNRLEKLAVLEQRTRGNLIRLLLEEALKARMIVSLLIVSLLILTTVLTGCTGCGGVHNTASPPVPISIDYFPMIAQSFTMNNYCAGAMCGHTFVTYTPAADSCSGLPALNKKQTKDDTRAYWQPGYDQAWDMETYTKQPDGSIMFTATQGGAANTQDIPPAISISDTGFAILPSDMSNPPAELVQPQVTSYILKGSLTAECLTKNTLATIMVEPWTVRWHRASIDTPAYIGKTLAADLMEGAASTGNYISETHYFAPGLGLVQIDFYNLQTHAMSVKVVRQ